MKRLLIVFTFILFSNVLLAQTFSSKAEAMDYSRMVHNGAIVRLQQYLKSNSVDDLIAALKNSITSSELATKVVSDMSDVLSYGSDAVKIVKTNNYLMAFFVHELIHDNVSGFQNQFELKRLLDYYNANLMWMMHMMELNKQIEWLWGTITEPDLNAIMAFIQYSIEDSTWEINDKLAGDKSILIMIGRNYFDMGCFKINGRWILF